MRLIRSKSRNFVFVLLAIGVNVAANNPKVQDWIPHAMDWGVIISAVILILMIIFQISKRGWKVIGRGLSYFAEFIAWPFPRSGFEACKTLKERYGWIDNPLQIWLEDPGTQSISGYYRTIRVAIEYRGIETRFVEEIFFIFDYGLRAEFGYDEDTQGRHPQWGKNPNRHIVVIGGEPPLRIAFDMPKHMFEKEKKAAVVVFSDGKSIRTDKIRIVSPFDSGF